jgi:tRNA(Ile)-lysidine synthetase-like protein
MKDRTSARERSSANAQRRALRSGLEQRVLRRARDRGLCGVPIVVGFSGGSDSLCLAAVLAAVQRNLSISPVLVHVDHGLRPESDREAERASELARSLELPLTVVRLGNGFQQRHPGAGVEEAARRERYLALSNEAGKLGSDLVAIAHHQTDQAETVLLHLLRGAGVEGARGMRELSTMTLPWWSETEFGPTSIRLWRPLLPESKGELDEYVESSGLSPVQDSSNTDRSFRRNAVRHDILPATATVFPAALASLARFAEIAAEEDELVHELAMTAYRRLRNGDETLDLAEWMSIPIAIQRRVMLMWLRERSGTDGISFERVIAVTDLAQSSRFDSKIEVAAGCSALLIGKNLAAGTEDELIDIAWSRFPGPRISFDVSEPIEIKSRDEKAIGNVVFRTESVLPDAGACRSHCERLPYPASGHWFVREVQGNDRFRNGQRVADWLRSRQVPGMIRGKLLCFEDDGHVAWVPGLPLPPRAALTASDRDLLVSWRISH